MPDKNMFPKILRAVGKIPRGKVATYGDVAYIAGYPGSARQVAWALHSSSRGLPWHRVVGAGGKILLPAEGGMEQRFRLEAEGVQFSGLRIEMQRYRWTPYKRKKAIRKRKK